MHLILITEQRCIHRTVVTSKLVVEALFPVEMDPIDCLPKSKQSL